MKILKKFFKKPQIIPLDIFFNKILYDQKFGYYSKKNPFGKNGDFITSPNISYLFGEVIAIWLVAYWENLKKPKNFSIVEMGPGNGELTRSLIKTFKKFPKFNNIVNLYLCEKSKVLEKIQKKNIKEYNVKWISNFNNIKKGPILFLGNEFFDAIPIKQFKRVKGILYQKHINIDENYMMKEVFKKASKKDVAELKKFNALDKLDFIEFPKLGFIEMNKIIKKIKKLSGGLLLIDYGYIKQINQYSMQSVKQHKKNKIYENLGEADVTSLVNFELLNSFFRIKKMSTNEIKSQSAFLKKIGILYRAEIVSKNMTFKGKSDLYLRLKRLLDPKFMGEIFKVFFAYKKTPKITLGFD